MLAGFDVAARLVELACLSAAGCFGLRVDVEIGFSGSDDESGNAVRSEAGFAHPIAMMQSKNNHVDQLGPLRT
jgi:hypothetical protein